MPTAIIFDIEATGKDNSVLVEAAWVALEGISPFTLGEECLMSERTEVMLMARI
jgi:hypothetical protein